MRRAGVEPETLVTRITSRVKEIEREDERLKKRYELPPFLKHFATNLNLLARQDKLPPVHGRDAEIQQTVEVLSHRERANSVMLVGEPGVGKTAIAEGLARRIEFEPETLPVRLRDCHIVSLQLNSLVAGTMLRGMFEDRMQNVLRELRERHEPDPVHRRGAHAHRRRLGAGRAVGRRQRPQGRAGPRRGARSSARRR